MRVVSTLVLPEPAPATIRLGPSVCKTAARWASFRPWMSCSILSGVAFLGGLSGARRGTVRAWARVRRYSYTGQASQGRGWAGAGPSVVQTSCIGAKVLLRGNSGAPCICPGPPRVERPNGGLGAYICLCKAGLCHRPVVQLFLGNPFFKPSSSQALYLR